MTHAQRETDYLIIGAGPAGLQLGFYLEKKGRNYLILEADATAGAFFKRFPRHRKLISINKVHTGFDDTQINMRWDWNSLLSDDDDLLFKHFSKEYFPPADVMVDYLATYAQTNRLKIEYGAKVQKVEKRDDRFVVNAENGNAFSGKRLIVATGLFKPYLPEIQGIELAEDYCDMSVDPSDFEGQRVLIVGKGNSAFETADNLIGTTSLLHLVSPKTLTMAWKSHFVGHLRAVNNTVLDSYLLKSQNVVLDASITKITKESDRLVATFSYSHANGEVEDHCYDRVLLCTGFRMDSSIFGDSCKPERVIFDKLPAQTTSWESTNVEDLYFAGTLMQTRDYKQKQSSFIHGFRYNVRFLAHLLEKKYHGESLPCRHLGYRPDAISDVMIERINNNSALWQQTGFLCDMVVEEEGGTGVLYYESVPVDYAHEVNRNHKKPYFLMTMEFGQEIIDASPDVFGVERIHKEDFERAHLSTAIHPIIRQFVAGEQLAEHHVIEHITAQWLEDIHKDPLTRFLETKMGVLRPASAAT